MLARLRSRAQEEKGFTLIELLVVVLIIGILAAIAIPAFLGQKKGAQDSNAKSLLRNAAISMESFYSEEQDFVPASGTIAAAAQLIEPNISFSVGTAADAKTNAVAITPVDSAGGTAYDSYVLNTRSASGTYFAYLRDKDAKTAKCKGTAVETTVATGPTCAGTSTGTW